MTRKREPGRAITVGRRPIMTRQNTANNVFVNINAECKCDLLDDDKGLNSV